MCNIIDISLTMNVVTKFLIIEDSHIRRLSKVVRVDILRQNTALQSYAPGKSFTFEERFNDYCFPVTI